jgi:ankyrin repeat protein
MRKSVIFLCLIFSAGTIFADDKPRYKPLNKSFESAVIAGNTDDVNFYIQKIKTETRASGINKPMEKAKGAGGSTPLATAIKQGNLPMVKLLVENGADVNLKNGPYYPLAAAVKAGQKDIAVYLLSLGTPGKDSLDSALLEAAGDFTAIPDSKMPQRNTKEPRNSGSLEMFKILAGSGADIKRNESNLFIRAIDNNNIELIKYLIEKGADVNARSSFGRSTPVFGAVLRNNKEIAEFLYKSGADINAKNDAGVSPVFITVGNEKDKEIKKQRFEMLQYLVSIGADINAADNYGNTPLTKACDIRDFDTIKFLIENGADVNREEVLPYSVQRNGIEILSYLVEHGADVKTRNGALALLTAANAENNEAIKFLKEKGADAAMAENRLPKKYQRFKESFTDVYINMSF